MSKYNKTVKNKWIWLIPLVIAIGIVPFIVRMDPTKMAYIESFLLGKESTNDFFSKAKANLVIFSGAIALIMFLYRYIGLNKTKDIKQMKLYIPIGIYTIFAIVSTLGSKYIGFFSKNFPNLGVEGVDLGHSIAVWGFWDRYEGLLVLLGYMILLMYAINIINNDFDIKVVINSALIGACVVGLIGIFQFFGLDLFKTDLGRAIMVPFKYSELRQNIAFHFGKGTIYSTLYNTNYVGTYMAVILPIAISLFLFAKDKKYKYIFGSISCLVFANLIGSNSTTGMVAALVAFPFLIFLLRKVIIRQWKQVGILLSIFLVIFIFMDISADHKISRELGFNFGATEPVKKDITPIHASEELVDIKLDKEDIEIYGEAVQLRVGLDNRNQFVFTDDNNYILPYFAVNNNLFQMHFTNEILSLLYDDGAINFLNTAFRPIDFEQKENKIILNDPLYEDYDIKYEQDGKIITVVYKDHKVIYDFTTDDDLNITYNDYEIYEIDKISKDSVVMVNPTLGSINGSSIKVLDERYYHYHFLLNKDGNYLRTNMGGKDISFVYTANGAKIVSNGGYILDNVGMAESAFFEGKERFGSSRGYIWSRSIPLLYDNILIGTGPDTFAMAFPQNEIVGKVNHFRSSQILVDKPHNMYLQMGINTGVVSLIALLVLFVVYGLWTLKLYWKRDINSYSDYVAIGILVAVIGYLISGIGNDSIVSIAPVFWVLLGVGISINYRTQRENNNI